MSKRILALSLLLPLLALSGAFAGPTTDDKRSWPNEVREQTFRSTRQAEPGWYRAQAKAVGAPVATGAQERRYHGGPKYP